MNKHVVFVTWKTGNAPAFEAAKRLGHEVTLIRSRAMERMQHVDFDTTPFGRFVDTVHTLDDATELDALRACVTEIHARRPIDGFLATVDALVVPVARIADELGIPFTSSHGAETAKAKNRCRETLAAAGIDGTRHEIVRDLGQALAFAATTGYPVVVKPASGSGSQGAHVLADADALAAFFSEVLDAELYQAGLLVEEYLSGRFVSAEIGLARGETVRLAVSERETWDRHEALEVGTTIPAAIDAEHYEIVMDFAERVIKAVDLRMGIFHVEVMLTADGPRLIELNPRIMGSCLPNLFCLAGGGDLFELLVRIYLDEPVDVGTVEFDKYATVRWFGAAEETSIPAEVPDLSWVDGYGEAVHSLSVRFPEAGPLVACRGNLDNFGEVQVAHADHGASIGIAEEIVQKIEAQLGIELTK
ncbi:Biotin carboxylase [Actinokineospora alba]|uniref:Biotin carboxylase n=1 Tax=Actinokineospora alba TaxID=504798 RepID=A0A1H0QT79_9PSEU|nr:ATP-grasp domain-containing protein [Actinokineospora alba]TDP70410.1 biotin carboxylase [Actinokineospora alba]SDI32238.1 Biotin carboxylase [Actinokineospora alba]SDP20400.1 Biotin carboxylase [Actinokineospora alba]